MPLRAGSAVLLTRLSFSAARRNRASCGFVSALRRRFSPVPRGSDQDSTQERWRSALSPRAAPLRLAHCDLADDEIGVLPKRSYPSLNRSRGPVRASTVLPSPGRYAERADSPGRRPVHRTRPRRLDRSRVGSDRLAPSSLQARPGRWLPPGVPHTPRRPSGGAVFQERVRKSLGVASSYRCTLVGQADESTRGRTRMWRIRHGVSRYINPITRPLARRLPGFADPDAHRPEELARKYQTPINVFKRGKPLPLLPDLWVGRAMGEERPRHGVRLDRDTRSGRRACRAGTDHRSEAWRCATSRPLRRGANRRCHPVRADADYIVEVML